MAKKVGKKLSGFADLVSRIIEGQRRGKSSVLGVSRDEFERITQALDDAREKCAEDFEDVTLQRMACTHGIAEVARALNRLGLNALNGSRGAKKAKRSR